MIDWSALISNCWYGLLLYILILAITLIVATFHQGIEGLR